MCLLVCGEYIKYAHIGIDKKVYTHKTQENIARSFHLAYTVPYIVVFVTNIGFDGWCFVVFKFLKLMSRKRNR